MEEQIKSLIRDDMSWIKRSVETTNINKDSLKLMIRDIRLGLDRIEFNTNKLQ